MYEEGVVYDEFWGERSNFLAKILDIDEYGFEGLKKEKIKLALG